LIKSATFAPFTDTSFNSSAVFTLFATAASAILCANATKSAFLETKSVSQEIHTTKPVLLSAEVCAMITPSFASRSLRLAAYFLTLLS
jgi:hypothetical protein